MAQKKSTLQLQELLLKFMTEEDPFLSMLEWITQEMIRIESEQKVGAQKGKHSEERTTHFSGTRVRKLNTRMGTLYLVIPKIRKGGYVPFFVTEKKRSEQALIEMVQEAYINGVSTRKIERLAKKLGIEGISASQVSDMNKGLDAIVHDFRTKQLEKEYPVLWVDAIYEHVRNNGRVESMAAIVVSGVTVDGKRELLAVEPMVNESEETYIDVLSGLKARGVEKVWLVVSDAHQGIKKAAQRCFIGSTWQRCKVHFMRNIMAHIGHKDKDQMGTQIKQIWLQHDKQSAQAYAESIVEEYESKYPKAMEILLNGLEDSLQFFYFSMIDHRKIASTNTLERLNKEIRRRSNVIGIYPSKESYMRVIITYLIEYSEDWVHKKSYIHAQHIQELKEKIIGIA